MYKQLQCSSKFACFTRHGNALCQSENTQHSSQKDHTKNHKKLTASSTVQYTACDIHMSTQPDIGHRISTFSCMPHSHLVHLSMRVYNIPGFSHGHQKHAPCHRSPATHMTLLRPRSSVSAPCTYAGPPRSWPHMQTWFGTAPIPAASVQPPAPTQRSQSGCAKLAGP